MAWTAFVERKRHRRAESDEFFLGFFMEQELLDLSFSNSLIIGSFNFSADLCVLLFLSINFRVNDRSQSVSPDINFGVDEGDDDFFGAESANLIRFVRESLAERK
uniref:Uncharacterized protein n=1 Tax=Romanomermis culicivorax TaxID=13658 RepID=A0A915JY34_ROMCU